ncbi:hypothetical protein C8N29_11294 [Agitococcus lubricus]|uniref:Uncharacterized protein n=1 Tax=Agitococcus lubricus TaxID=1077255 RepID=A0A2T5IWY8_9GAMM|nr:hypothetical protein C8N29_11294 [Agitococcus lubricus]
MAQVQIRGFYVRQYWHIFKKQPSDCLVFFVQLYGKLNKMMSVDVFIVLAKVIIF